jgi:hypothetical protein
MAFVNERYSPEDAKKFHLDEIDANYGIGLSTGNGWTVDRERGYYLRFMERGREEWLGEYVFDLFWEGHLFRFRFRVKGGGVRGGAGWRRYSLLRMDMPLSPWGEMPPDLKPRQEETLSALKEALTAFKDFGVHSATTSFEASFDF